MATVRYTVLDGEVIAEKRSGVRREYVPDPLGSTTALLDSTQTATDTFNYWPYGEEQARTGSTAIPFEYVGTLGYYRDSSTKTYVRARYLNTGQGRWMTQDPIGFEGGDLNLYRYVGNHNVTVVDPNGLEWWCCLWGVGWCCDKPKPKKLTPGQTKALEIFANSCRCGEANESADCCQTIADFAKEFWGLLGAIGQPEIPSAKYLACLAACEKVIQNPPQKRDAYAGLAACLGVNPNEPGFLDFIQYLLGQAGNVIY